MPRPRSPVQGVIHLGLPRTGLLLACLLVAACASQQRDRRPETTFVVVRHAEKLDDGSRDPPLSPAGAARARRLADSLRKSPLRAAYATTYRRTQQTAAPSAQAHGIVVRTYDAAMPVDAFAAQLLGGYHGGTVLVVGHSNTAPRIAAALCACATTPLGDADYGRVYRITIDAAGHAVLHEAVLP